MKKLALLLALMFVASFGWAGTSGEAVYSVEIKAGLSILVDPASYDLGIIKLGGIKETIQPNALLPRIKNDGADNLKVRVELVNVTMPADWIWGGISQVGPKRGAFLMGIRPDGTSGAITWTDENHRLEPGTPLIADGVILEKGGYNMATNEVHVLESKFWAPTELTTTEPATFKITITALAM